MFLLLLLCKYDMCTCIINNNYLYYSNNKYCRLCGILVCTYRGAKTWVTVFTCYIYNGYSKQDRHTIVYI